MALELGPWEALPLQDVVDFLADAPFRWWIAGGHALELHLGRSWREHADIDVGICRQDALRLRAALDGWQIAVAADGVLSPWDGGALLAERHENNLWCRRRADGPWELDVLVGDGDDDRWRYRRDLSVHLPWDDVSLTSRTGVPYLAPEVQLLFKSATPRPKDQIDAAEVIPALGRPRRDRLAGWLAPGHPWHGLLHGRT